MALVLGLLEAREKAACERIERLREEGGRILAELGEAEGSLERLIIARVAPPSYQPRDPAATVSAPTVHDTPQCGHKAVTPAFAAPVRALARRIHRQCLERHAVSQNTTVGFADGPWHTAHVHREMDRTLIRLRVKVKSLRLSVGHHDAETRAHRRYRAG